MLKLWDSSALTDERGRDYYFDNAKFMLILSVVIAHLISPIKSEMDSVRTLWTVINAVHMPAFIFISGYFAKSYVKKDGSFKFQRLLTYIVYYMAAQIAVSVFEYFVLHHTSMEKSFFYPRSSLWYLMCLCIWHILLPYIAKLKPSYVMIAAVVCGLLVGYDTGAGSFLSNMRVVSHFPFFMAGYYFKKEWFFKFRNAGTRLLALAGGILITVWTYFNLDKITPRIITSADRYRDCQLKYFTAFPVMWVNRFLYYILACIMIAMLLLLVPRCKTFFTKLGSRTLQVYILHRFIYLAELDYQWHLPFVSGPGAVAMVLIAIALTFILSLKVFEYPFKALAGIRIEWFLKKEEQ